MPHPIRIPWQVRTGWDEFGAARPGLGVPHRGFDYHVPIGTPIYGTGPGGVVKQNSPGAAGANSFGNNITIAYPGRVTVDAHMQARSPLPVGARVDQTTIVGYVGNTGSAAGVVWRGLGQDHHELRVVGVLTDPIAYYGTTTAGGIGTPITDPVRKDDTMPHLWLYTSADPDLWIEIDYLTMTYRIPATGSLEAQSIANDVAAGRRYDVIADPAWGATFGNGQYRQITKPDPLGGASVPVDPKVIAAAVNAELADDFAKVNANIDDQPTTFKVTPA